MRCWMTNTAMKTIVTMATAMGHQPFAPAAYTGLSLRNDCSGRFGQRVSILHGCRSCALDFLRDRMTTV
ncbi:exported hypothetical protein [Frigoribacterium sp. 9N]|nr:exported hypothetical protein [Frigoribacterium sp. 9N]